MLRKGNLYSCNMTKMAEKESGKGWEQRLDFAERMALSPKAAHLHKQSPFALREQAPTAVNECSAQLISSHLISWFSAITHSPKTSL